MNTFLELGERVRNGRGLKEKEQGSSLPELMMFNTYGDNIYHASLESMVLNMHLTLKDIMHL